MLEAEGENNFGLSKEVSDNLELMKSLNPSSQKQMVTRQKMNQMKMSLKLLKCWRMRKLPME